jgi:acetyl-CoA synthetase (ADP-forming)/acetyltransferase
MVALRSLLDPRSIALIEASPPPSQPSPASGGGSGWGQVVAANLLGSASNGDVFVVGVDGGSAQTDRCYRKVDDLPISPDLAIICTSAAAAPDALDQAGRKGIKAAVVMTADPHGADPVTPLKKSLREVARERGCRFLGPGSVGINMPAVGLNASLIATCPAAGKLALISQCGAIAAGAVEWAASHGIGLSRVISLGDEADVALDEIFDYLAADSKTAGILLYLRSPAAGRAFVSSARALARIKPILVLKPREDPVPAQTQAPRVDQDEVYDAVFRRTGLLRVYDTAEWFDAAESLSRVRQRRSGKLAIVANGQGPARLAAAPIVAQGLLASLQDQTAAALQQGIPGGMPAVNPMDLGRDATAADYTNTLAALQDDPNVAAALVIHAPTPNESSAAVARAVAAAAKHGGLNVSACWFGAALDDGIRAAFADANVALYDMPEKAARAFVHLDRHRRNQEALRQIPVSRRQQLAAGAAEPTAGSTISAHALQLSDEKEGASFLTAYAGIWRAIKTKREMLDGGESIAVLRAFGFPAATTSQRPLLPLPLTLAITNDATFGRVILVSAAGERAVALPPLNMELTRDMAANAQAALRLATGIEVSAELLQQSVIRLADLAVELPEITMLETMSIGANDHDLVVLGARIRVAAPGRTGNHLSIHPYPRELEERVRLPAGQDVLIRPMRIEDIRLYHKMLNSLPAGDLFLRFCSLFGDLTQAIPTELLANLIHFDYSRDMTFIAIGAGSRGEAEALGLVDAFISPGRDAAEYSILVRSDLAGTGLGKALMARIIAYCRAQGVESLFGLVLRNNVRMLGLCARLGFATASDENDDDMVKVVLPL